MAGMNIRSLPQQTIEKVFQGLRGSEMALIERISGVRKHQVKALAGILPALTTASTLPRNASRIPQGAQAKPLSMGMSNPEYRCERCPGLTRVPDGVKIDMDGLGLNALDEFAKSCLRQSNHVLNTYFNTILTSTVENKTDSAAVVWKGNEDTATPIADFQNIVLEIGKFDTIIMGLEAMQALQLTDAFKAQMVNYSSLSAVTEGVVVGKLKELFPHVKEVIIADDQFNSANEGQEPVLDFTFGGTVWAGYAENLAFIEQVGENRAEREREVSSRSTLLSYEINADIKRVDKFTGFYLSGILA